MMQPLTFVIVAIWIVVASGGLPPVIRIGMYLMVDCSRKTNVHHIHFNYDKFNFTKKFSV